MDDMSIMISSATEGKWLLRWLGLILWAMMNFNPSKSKLLMLKQSKVAEKTWFTISRENIPILTKKKKKINKKPGKNLRSHPSGYCSYPESNQKPPNMANESW